MIRLVKGIEKKVTFSWTLDLKKPAVQGELTLKVRDLLFAPAYLI